MTAEQLKEKLQAARERRNVFTDEKYKKRQAYVEVLDKEYAPVLTKIDEEIRVLQEKLDAASVKEAVKNNNGPYPIGTTLFESRTGWPLLPFHTGTATGAPVSRSRS